MDLLPSQVLTSLHTPAYLSAKVCSHDPLSLVACLIYVLSLMYHYMKLKVDFFLFLFFLNLPGTFQKTSCV